MKHSEEFYKQYKFDNTSPTGITRLSNGKPAGCKIFEGKLTYNWDLVLYITGKKDVRYSLPRLVYEGFYGYPPHESQVIAFVDGNKDNLDPLNMILYPKTGNQKGMKSRELRTAYRSFRTVQLPRSNPDYFNDPKDWTDPVALKLLDEEKHKRDTGESVEPKLGRPRRYK